jgi:hypothetical protein
MKLTFEANVDGTFSIDFYTAVDLLDWYDDASECSDYKISARREFKARAKAIRKTLEQSEEQK